MADRVFTSRYRAGVFFSPGPGLLLVPLIFVPGMSLFKNALISAAFAVGLFALVTLFWTRRRTSRPALSLSYDGADIEGLPHLDWRQIAGVHRGLDGAGRPALMIALKEPVARIGQSPLWQAQDRAILLRANLLADPIDQIEEAFTYFRAV